MLVTIRVFDALQYHMQEQIPEDESQSVHDAQSSTLQSSCLHPDMEHDTVPSRFIPSHGPKQIPDVVYELLLGALARQETTEIIISNAGQPAQKQHVVPPVVLEEVLSALTTGIEAIRASLTGVKGGG